MKPLKKSLKLKKKEYYETHLNIVNCVLPIQLTPKEIQVLARFMSLNGEIALDRFGTSARKIVKDEMSISSGGLGNYLKSLREKGFIIESNGKMEIVSILFPDVTQQVYMFHLLNEDS